MDHIKEKFKEYKFEIIQEDEYFTFKNYENNEYAKEIITVLKYKDIKMIYLAMAILYGDISLVAFVINNLEINIHDDLCKICLLTTCSYTKNLSVIKYIIDDVKCDITHLDAGGYNLLLAACSWNSNVNVIKYLIEDKKMDTTACNKHGYNCLLLSCVNENLEIIKYLIEDIRMDSDYLDNNDDNCLLIASHHNTNFDVIKYLIEDVKIDTNHWNNYNYNCLISAFCNNENIEIVKYLIEKTTAYIALNITPYNKFKSVVPFITHNYERFNVLFEKAINEYGSLRIITDVVPIINPLMLNKKMCEECKIAPFDDKYSNFVINTDKLECKLPVAIDTKTLDNKKKRSRINIDFSGKVDFLFVHNNISYYGHKKVVYDAIRILNDSNNYDFAEPIILTTPVPKYIVNLYIDSCYNGIFDVNEIKNDNFFQFLNFVDQYETKYVSIPLLEKELIMYMNDNKIIPNDYLKNICKKYQLKYLHLYINDKLLL
jgi:hypothetical protein